MSRIGTLPFLFLLGTVGVLCVVTVIGVWQNGRNRRATERLLDKKIDLLKEAAKASERGLFGLAEELEEAAKGIDALILERSKSPE